jgi:hypothetical protein
MVRGQAVSWEDRTKLRVTSGSSMDLTPSCMPALQNCKHAAPSHNTAKRPGQTHSASAVPHMCRNNEAGRLWPGSHLREPGQALHQPGTAPLVHVLACSTLRMNALSGSEPAGTPSRTGCIHQSTCHKLCTSPLNNTSSNNKQPTAHRATRWLCRLLAGVRTLVSPTGAAVW